MAASSLVAAAERWLLVFAHSAESCGAILYFKASFISFYWEEIGKSQFEFMKQQGLLPEHRFIDVGCGALRGGVHVIRFLDKGNFFGPAIPTGGRTFSGGIGLPEATITREITFKPNYKFRW